MSVKLLVGDCTEKMRELPEQSVHCCVTSPPYFGLRDYGHEGQIGLEATPGDYVQRIVEVFREVRRVLRDDGTVWLNLGDSYASGGRGGGGSYMAERGDAAWSGRNNATGWRSPPEGLKHKDLVGIPWRVAFALQDDGWYLRQDIIWHKPNPMPESVTDRCTKAHEYLFLLSKSPRYYYDAESVKEPAGEWTGRAGTFDRSGNAVADHVLPGQSAAQHRARSGNKERKPRPGPDGDSRNQKGSVPWEGATRNKRSVWTVSTRPYAGAHFATFPPALVEPCILAGCPRDGVVLDPFAGSGTTGYVADYLQRHAVLIELSHDYAELIRERMAGAGMFNPLEAA